MCGGLHRQHRSGVEHGKWPIVSALGYDEIFTENRNCPRIAELAWPPAFATNPAKPPPLFRELDYGLGGSVENEKAPIGQGSHVRDEFECRVGTQQLKVCRQSRCCCLSLCYSKWRLRQCEFDEACILLT